MIQWSLAMCRGLQAGKSRSCRRSMSASTLTGINGYASSRFRLRHGDETGSAGWTGNIGEAELDLLAPLIMVDGEPTGEVQRGLGVA